jgi:OOP family OmpA-OmpF porin
VLVGFVGPWKDVPNEVPVNTKGHKSIAFDELRRLLVGPEQTEIVQLKERLADSELLVKDVSEVLPEAIILRSSRDKKIAKALEPTIEEAIRASVKKDRRALADALFPVMAPAIRKVISSIILKMIQSLNQALEHSFSMQGLKWRLEALRTGKPFGEVVLLHTLIYQVEQVFLIHRNTGLVLQHVVARRVAAQDPDLVSSMLTAIQDFVQDSFGVERGEPLEALRIGDRSIWIEQGPQATLAAVIRGMPPADFQVVLRETLDDIHLKQMGALESFDGDATPFEPICSQLEDCLQSQCKQMKRKISPFLLMLLGAVVLLIGIWFFDFIRDYQRWAHYVERLRTEPGIVVTTIEKRSGKKYISGLRDPLAADPAKMLKEASIEPEKVIFNWEPYQSLYPKFQLTRIKGLLRPPETIRLTFQDGTLYADGSASHQWIVEARQLVKSIPGITHFDEEKIIHIDLRDMEIIRERIEKQFLLFRTIEAEIAPGQQNTIQELVANTKRLCNLAQVLGKNARIEIVGHTDNTGSEETNMKLSRERAHNVLSILTSRGLKKKNFTAIGVGSKEPLCEEATEMDRESNRRVDFKVTLTDKPKEGVVRP